MTRDMELIRKIIIAIQNRKDAQPQLELELVGYDPMVVTRHREMLFNAGFIDGAVVGLSLDGHDFAAAVNNENVWSVVKQKLSPNELATLPLTFIKDLVNVYR